MQKANAFPKRTSIIRQALEGIKENDKRQEEMKKRFDKEWSKWGFKRSKPR